MPKSLIHYRRTDGLVGYISTSLTAAKGPNGTDLVVGHTLSVLQRLAFLTRQAVVVVWAATCRAVGVTLLAVVGVIVAVGAVRTDGNTSSL